MNELITLHLGSRLPKQYEKDGDPANPVLAKEQPGLKKCRIKIRISKHSNLHQALDETARIWKALDHGDKPAWVAGTDEFMVQAVARMFGTEEIRPFEPEAGDE